MREKLLFLHPANGFHEEFARGVEAEFLTDVCLVGVHRFRAEFELGSDAVGVHSTADHLEDLELAVTEQAARLTTGGTATAKAATSHDAGQQIGTEEETTTLHLADGENDAAQRLGLHEITHGTSTKAALCHDVLIMTGENEDLDGGMRVFDFFDDIDSAAILRRDFDDSHVWLELGNFLKGCRFITRMPDQLEFIQSIERFFETFDHDRVVIEDVDFVFQGVVLVFGFGG